MPNSVQTDNASFSIKTANNTPMPFRALQANVARTMTSQRDEEHRITAHAQINQSMVETFRPFTLKTTDQIAY